MTESTCLHIQDRESGPIRVVELPGISVRIGRAPHCEIQLTELGRAEEVCRLLRRGQSWQLVPNGKGGPIRLEGRSLSGCCLLPFDVPFFVGSYCLTLRHDRTAQPDWGSYPAPGSDRHSRKASLAPSDLPRVERQEPERPDARSRATSEPTIVALAIETNSAPAEQEALASLLEENSGSAPADEPASSLEEHLEPAAEAERETSSVEPLAGPQEDERAAGFEEVPAPDQVAERAGSPEQPPAPSQEELLAPSLSERWETRWRAAGAEIKARSQRARGNVEPMRPAQQSRLDPVPLKQPGVPRAHPLVAPSLDQTVRPTTPIAQSRLQPTSSRARMEPSRTFTPADLPWARIKAEQACARAPAPPAAPLAPSWDGWLSQDQPAPPQRGPKPVDLADRLATAPPDQSVTDEPLPSDSVVDDRTVADPPAPTVATSDDESSLVLIPAIDAYVAELSQAEPRSPEFADATPPQDQPAAATEAIVDDARFAAPYEEPPIAASPVEPVPHSIGSQEDPRDEQPAIAAADRAGRRARLEPLPREEQPAIAAPDRAERRARLEPLPREEQPAIAAPDRAGRRARLEPLPHEEQPAIAAPDRAGLEPLPELHAPAAKNGEWPSARDILASHRAATRPRPVVASARKASSKNAPASAAKRLALPTLARSPGQWSPPVWLAGPPAAAFVLAVGIAGCFLSFRWAGDSYAAAIVTDRLLTEDTIARSLPLPESMSPPEGSWTVSTAGHLARWAIYLSHFQPERRLSPEDTALLLERALQVSPLDRAARLALAQLEPPGTDTAVRIRSLGLSRDAVSLTFSARRLLAAGQKKAALKIYGGALAVAIPASSFRATVPRFSEDAGVARYLLPGEAQVRDILRELLARSELSFSDWSSLVPDNPVALLAAARLLREQSHREADGMLDQVLGESSRSAAVRMTDSMTLAARAEAHALQSRWRDADRLYRQAIELESDETVRRSWWFNLADISARLEDDGQRQVALQEAMAALSGDDIRRRATDIQRASRPPASRRMPGVKAN